MLPFLTVEDALQLVAGSFNVPKLAISHYVDSKKHNLLCHDSFVHMFSGSCELDMIFFRCWV